MKTPKPKTGPKAQPGRGKARGGVRDQPSAGSRILVAIEEATELLRSEGLESRQLTVRTYRRPPRAAIGPRTSSGCGSYSGPARRC
jgi:hypothetical protein